MHDTVQNLLEYKIAHFPATWKHCRKALHCKALQHTYANAAVH